MDITARPPIEVLFKLVVPRVATYWRDIGFALGLDGETMRSIIKMNHQEDTTSCKAIFNKWLETSSSANWDQLIKAAESAKLEGVVEVIQALLQMNPGSH